MHASHLLFQRTEAGRQEIKNKSHGLTQSERLVLILVDGVTPVAAMRNKLPALTDQRFARALHQLAQKELILEVFLPVEGQSAEQLDQQLVERFLQQEALDPVTIILQQLEEDLPELVVTAPAALSSLAAAPADQPAVSATPAAAAAIPTLTETAAPIAAMDGAHVAMAESLAAEVRQRQAERLRRRTEEEMRRAAPAPSPIVAAPAAPRLHWGYWLIALGVACIASFCIVRLTA